MKRVLAVLLAMVIAIPAAFSQAEKTYSQTELDQMLAPVALYPDPLLSQILMASTYPVEVVEAARWSRANPALQGDAAVQAVQGEDWDPGVKSLAAFPQILQWMDDNLEWTRAVGDAFLAQQPLVMDTVQQLRQRAQAAGNLQTSGQLVVQQQAGEIYIQPANPQIVYVPQYDPAVVYYRPAPLRWAAPVALSVSFFFGRPDWRHHTVSVARPVIVNSTVVVKPGGWHHDPNHRRGVAYRDAHVQQRFAASTGQQHRYQRPPGRDMHDSKVLSAPRSEARSQAPARADARPQAPARVQAQAPAQPRPHVQPQPHPQAKAQPRPRTHVPQEEERRQARNGHSRGNDRS